MHCCSSPLINHSATLDMITNLSLWLKVWTNWVRIYFESSIYWETKNITMMRAKTTTDNYRSKTEGRFGLDPFQSRINTEKAKFIFTHIFRILWHHRGPNQNRNRFQSPGRSWSTRLKIRPPHVLSWPSKSRPQQPPATRKMTLEIRWRPQFSPWPWMLILAKELRAYYSIIKII